MSAALPQAYAAACEADDVRLPLATLLMIVLAVRAGAVAAP